MEKKRNSRLLLIILSFMIIFSLLNLSIPVNAVISYTKICGWDDVASGLDDGTSGFFEFNNCGDVNEFETTTTQKRTSPNGFKIYESGDKDIIGFFNLTQTFTYISSINFSFWANFASSVDIVFDFYNDNNDIVAKIDFLGDTEIIRWYDDGGWENLYAFTTATWFYITITHNGTNQFNIKIYNTSNGVVDNGDYAGMVTEWDSFSYIKVTSSLGGVFTGTLYIDDFYVSTETQSSSETSPCDIEDCQQIGYDSPSTTLTLYDYKIFAVREVLMNGVIKAISLCIGSEMYNLDPNPDNYEMEFLGFPRQSADDIVYVGQGLYRVWWCVDVDLSDEDVDYPHGQYLFCDFIHDTPLYNNIYWYVAVSTSDLDSDGNIGFKTGSSETIRPQLLWNYDIGMSYWVEQPYVPPPIVFDDTIGMQGYDYVNDTGYVYYMDNPNGMLISYTLSSNAYDHVIWCHFNDDVGITNIQLPSKSVSLDFPSGIVSYNGQDNANLGNFYKQVGKYEWFLYRSGYSSLASVTAYFVNRTEEGSYPSDFYIETRPSLTESYDDYEVFYIYNHTNSWNGALAVFKNYDDRNDLTKAYGHWDINSVTDDTGRIFLFTGSTAVTDEYWTLFTYRDDDYDEFVSVSYCTHYIQDTSVSPYGWIAVSPETLEIKLGNPENKYVTISGQHNMYLADISIFIDYNDWTSVTYDQVYSKNYITSKLGDHIAELKLFQNGSWILLDSASFTLVLSDDDGDGVIPPFNFIVPEPYSYFAGIFVILLFTLSPLAVVGFMSKSTGRDFNFSSIPQILYLILAIIGFVVTIVLEWFPPWTVAVLIVMCIVIIAIMWLQKGSSSEG